GWYRFSIKGSPSFQRAGWKARPLLHPRYGGILPKQSSTRNACAERKSRTGSVEAFCCSPESIRGCLRRKGGTRPPGALAMGYSGASGLSASPAILLAIVFRHGESPIREADPPSFSQDRDDLRLNWLTGDFDVFV